MRGAMTILARACGAALQAISHWQWHRDDRAVSRRDAGVEAIDGNAVADGAASAPGGLTLFGGPERYAARVTRKAVSAGRLLLLLTLVLTSALLMKCLVVLRPPKAFHPNWPAKHPEI